MDNQNSDTYVPSPSPNVFSKLKVILVQNKFLIIIIALLTTLSFGTTGYILVANKKGAPVPTTNQDNNLISAPTLPPPKEIEQPTKAPTPTPTALPIIPLKDPTATWSAYTSTKYSYSIKYPPNWTAGITVQTDPKILEYVVFNPVATKAGTLTITLSYGTRTYAQALALDPQTGESIVVASVSATKKNSKDSNGNKATNVIVPFGVNTIMFNAKEKYASLFDQMLTTLKLTK